MPRKRLCSILAFCASMMLVTPSFAQPGFTTDSSGTSLTLINGWSNAPFSTNDAKVEAQSGIVHFKGAIATTGTSAYPFVLPSAFRPSSVVWIPVDLCNATNGRLVIDPSGVVEVEVEGGLSWSYPQCFTSLDGASFALNSSGFTSLKLINGWKDSTFVSSKPGAKKINGIVHLRGAIATSGTSNSPFVLPKEFRPESYMVVPIDLCGATNGQLDIAPDGNVYVEAESGWNDAQCFTSLDGVSFPTSYSGFKDLTELNGWANEYPPAVRSSNGIVYLQGFLYTSGSNTEPFVLPSGYRPSKALYVPIALCNPANGIANGRLYITPNGAVSVQAEGTFSEAQCQTSLDGASFVK